MEQERSAPVHGTRQTTARAVVRRRCERSAVEAPLWRWRACKEGAIRSTRHKVGSGLRSGRLLWAAGWLYYRCRSHRYYPRHLCPRYCERHRVRRYNGASILQHRCADRLQDRSGTAGKDCFRDVADRLDPVAAIGKADDAARARFQALVAPREGADKKALV
jgi:hypothetical protein